MYSSSSITWGLKARPGESVVSPMVKWNNGILWEQLERKKQTCHISLRKKKKKENIGNRNALLKRESMRVLPVPSFWARCFQVSELGALNRASTQ